MRFQQETLAGGRFGSLSRCVGLQGGTWVCRTPWQLLRCCQCKSSPFGVPCGCVCCVCNAAGQRCAALRRSRCVLRVDFKLLSYTSEASVTVVTKQLGQEHLSEELASAADSPGTCLPAWLGPLLSSTKKNPALWSFILALIAWILIAEFGNILQL